jgi:NitT/TauT family transport system substrate-binding protein
MLALVIAMLLAATGCSAIGGASREPTTPGPLEKTAITVGTLSLIDSAPLNLAVDEGYFKAEGLNVELLTGSKGSVNVDNLIGGSIDFGLTSYPPALIAQAKGAAKLKIVADAVETTDGLVQVVVPPGSRVKRPEDLAGKKIGVSSKGGISELALVSRFKMMGMPVSREQFVSTEIASMPSFLARGDLDAAVITEPHLTGALKAGCIKLLDPFTGPTLNFPWSGWFATERFTQENPKTAAAFQRALARGVADAADRSKVEETVVKHIKVEASTAALMVMPVFPSTADPVRLQRVPDLLTEVGEISAKLDIRPMVLAPAIPPSWATSGR